MVLDAVATLTHNDPCLPASFPTIGSSLGFESRYSSIRQSVVVEKRRWTPRRVSDVA